MYYINTYIGTLNGVKGVWCGHYDDNIELEQTITVLRPDDGYVLSDGENTYDCVVNGLMENYTEIPVENETQIDLLQNNVDQF